MNDGSYICISKPAINDVRMNDIYDDANNNARVSNKGVRDCAWAREMYEGGKK